MAKKETSSDIWRDRYNLAADQQEPMFNKFQSWYDMKQGHIDSVMFAAWRSKVVLPIISAKIDSMVAKLQSLSPGWEIGLYGDALNDPDAQEKSNKAQWKLEHDFDNPKFDETMSDKLYSPLVDAHVCGTGIGKVPWCFGKQKRYQKYMDPQTKELDITKDEEITNEEGYNEFVPHDIMSTYIAPGSKNLYGAAWVILEDWVTYEQLTTENDASDGLLYDKAELKKIKEMKGTTDRFATQKASREMVTNGVDPIEADTTLKQFKRLECYERNGNIYTFVVGNNGESEESYVRIAYRKNIYWHGKYPLVAFYVKKRPHSFWGESVYETTERMQSGFSDLFNHLLDNLNLSQDGMYMVPEGENTAEPIIEPGGVWYYDQTEPKPFKFPEPNVAGITSVMNFLQSQIEQSTISSYATGTPNSATDTTQGTATGIMKLQEAAGDKTGAYKKQFANALREVGRQWLSNNQQFITQPITLMGQVDSKPAPVTIKPEDLQGELVLRINDASMEPPSKAEELQQFEAYLAQLNALQQASIQQAQMTKWTTEPIYYDYMSLAQDVSQKAGQANFEKIMLPQDKVDAAMQASQSPMVMPNERINITPADLMPSEVAQLLQRNGIQPDPSREQGALAPAEQVMGADTASTNAQTQNQQKAEIDATKVQNDQAKLGLEHAKLGLAADQQQHTQAKDTLDTLLKIHQSDHSQAVTEHNLLNGDPNGAKQTQTAGSSSGARQ